MKEIRFKKTLINFETRFRKYNKGNHFMFNTKIQRKDLNLFKCFLITNT